jgi:hypothetical protein
LLRFTKNVSSVSSVVSPRTDTAIVFVVVPAGKVTVPEAAV